MPEVLSVFGKAGRAETALDPAPLSMFETVIRLRPREEWRPGVDVDTLVRELDDRTRVPGMQGAWTMPIKARIDMLSTGIRTPIGIKVVGPDLETIAAANDQLETVLRTVPGTRSVYAERELGGLFLDVVPDRAAIARYGVNVADVLDVVEGSIGGLDATTTFEGRERYRVSVRYPRDLRGDVEALGEVLVPVATTPTGRTRGGPGGPGASRGGGEDAPAAAPGGASGMGMSGAGSAAAPSGGMDDGMGSSQAPARTAAIGMSSGARAFVPLRQLATIEPVAGPSMIKSEKGSLTGWIYVDLEGSDVGGWVDQAKRNVADQVELPDRVRLQWTGQYELLERVRARMAIVVPLTLLVVFAILYVSFRGGAQTLLVMTAVPFAAVGAIYTLALLGFNTSVAVWVGLIALLGVAAETASVMVVYLDEAWDRAVAEARVRTMIELVDLAVDAGSRRVRPLLMTVVTNILGLLLVLLDDGIGSDVAKRIAAPMWGGLVSLTVLTLLVVPAAWVVWRGRQLGRSVPRGDARGEAAEVPT